MYISFLCVIITVPLIYFSSSNFVKFDSFADATKTFSPGGRIREKV